MDTKWKNFSRSMPVKVVLNGLLILSIIVGAVCFKLLEMNIHSVEAPSSEKYEKGRLYGNKELQQEIQEQLKILLSEVLAEQTGIMTLSEEQSREIVKKNEKLDETLLDASLTEQSKKTKQSEEAQWDVKTGYDYWVSYSGEEEGSSIYQNATLGEKNLALEPFYVKYSGVRDNTKYIRSWSNQYQGKNVNYQWLDINEILQELCQGETDATEYVTEQIMEHLPYYKEFIQSHIAYCVVKDSEFTPVSYELYEKIYPDSAPEKMVYESLHKDMGYSDDWFASLTYNEASGLFYDESDGTYWDPEHDSWFNYEAEKEQYDKFVEKKNKREKAAQKALEQVGVKKGQEIAKGENPYKLTNSEYAILRENIKNALYLGTNCSEKEAQVSVPLAAIMGTPQEYNISFGVDAQLFEDAQGDYVGKYEAQKDKYQSYIEEKANTEIIFVGSIVVFMAALLGLLYVCGRKPGTEEVQELVIDRWYTEIQMVAAMGMMLAGGAIFTQYYYYYDGFRGVKMNNLVLTLIGLDIYLLVQLLCSFVRKAKARRLWKQSILGKIWKKQQEMSYYGNFQKRISLLALIVPAIVPIGVVLPFWDEIMNEVYGPLFLVMYVVLWAAFVWFVWKFGAQLNQIKDGVQRVRQGEISYQIPTDDSNGFMNLLAKDINSLSDGLENAVEEMVKSEKLKTELISNVSHDIKTPLTSIITYVDLIKKEDVQSEKVKEYVEVLDQKSQRLKVLTDDLFEAAKATSGAMNVDLIRMDAAALVNQAVGEFDEKFSKCDLHVHNNIPLEQYYVMADGRLAWRIVENVFSNVSKYALAGSRVYVDAKEQGDQVVITVKNISSSELNIDAKTLMERFTRGDRSRNTEGSGLGLNIAASLATLQNGTFYVEIDGDLFKSILELPKAAEEQKMELVCEEKESEKNTENTEEE